MHSDQTITIGVLMSDINTLIERWRADDTPAAEAIYNQYRDSIYRLAYGLLGEPADAEEVTQDALAYALINIKRYNPERASFATWLHTITISRCRDKRRRRRLSSVPLFTWLESGEDRIDPSSAPEDRANRAEARSDVWRAVQLLSPLLREAILLRYWAGHTYREMADILDCPVPTAQSRVRLAYEQLRTKLTRDDLAALEEEQAS